MAGRRPRVVKRRPAVLDIIESADFISRAGGIAASRRFVANVEKTAGTLARSPGLGTVWGDDAPELRGVRVSPVTGFRNHLIFYRPVEGGIELLRVLHGARDIEHIFHPDEDA